jgi:RND family efflux transporter MFP subunit
MYRITAPISGTIEEAPLKIGQSIAPGMIAFRVINFSKVKLVAEVSEAYANIIKKGNIIKVKFPDDKIEINAKIDFTSRFINPINRTFTIESFLKPGEAEYRANMMAVLNILDYTNSQAYVIPINYIQNDAKSQFVWVAEKQGNKYFAKKRAVTQGKSYNGLTEITNGLVESDKLITSNLFNLLENEEVKL